MEKGEELLTIASNINKSVQTLPLTLIYPAILDCDERGYIHAAKNGIGQLLSNYTITPKGHSKLETIKKENPELLRKF